MTTQASDHPEEKHLSKVLLIEDSPTQRHLIQHQLESASKSISLEWAATLAEGLDRLAQGGVDAVLLDLMLPDSSGIETLWRTLARAADVPIVVLTSLDDEELAVQAVQRGAQDYLGKEWINGEILVRSLRHAVERKRLQIRLERHAEDLERSNQDLREFSTVATEQMHSPIRVAAEEFEKALKEGALEPGAARRVEGALAGIGRLRRLLDDFGTYARIGLRAGTGAEADCGKILDEVRAQLKPEIEESGMKLTSDDLPVLPADPQDVRHLFYHLINNAILFRGEEPLRVHVGVRRDGDMWSFSVSDNGPGVDPDYPGQIFEAFQTLGASSGTGIGLAICKRVIDRNGGRIWVESEPGAGSVFRFTLPCARER